MKNRKLLILFIPIIIIIIIIVLWSISLQYLIAYIRPSPTPYNTHTPQIILDLREIWSLTNITLGYDINSPSMVANQRKVFLLGFMENELRESITCLNGLDGRIVWQKTDKGVEEPVYPINLGYPSNLFATTDGLYVGYGGVPSVKKFDIASGEVLWSQPLHGRGNMYIYVLEDEVQDLTTPENFTILNSSTGEVIYHIRDKEIFIRTPEETYISTGYGIKKTDTSTGELKWEVSLDHEMTLAPIFGEDMIFVRTGRIRGGAYAILRSTGAILWETDAVIISNLVISKTKEMVYALTENGELWGIKQKSGEIRTLIQFTDTPFVLLGEGNVGGYELAYDEMNGILFILLGDSRQLFAFQEQ